MKKVITAIAAAALVLVAVPAEAAPSYTNKQKNRYWNAVKARSADAYIIGKKDTIGMGIAVCDLLRSGGDLYDLAALVSEADPIIEEILIVSMAAAPVYLCKDQGYKFE